MSRKKGCLPTARHSRFTQSRTDVGLRTALEVFGPTIETNGVSRTHAASETWHSALSSPDWFWSAGT